MPAIPTVLILLGAFLAVSFIGRILLVTAAFGVSTAWGFTVLLVPFGPVIFRWNYRELAYPTRYWRRGAMLLLVLFVINGGSKESMQTLTNFGKTGTVVASAGDTQFHLPVPGKVVAAAAAQTDHTDPMAFSLPALPKAAASVAAAPATPVPAATPSKAVAAASATMPAAPTMLSAAERTEANRREFERLAEWYDTLKHERGYLRKNDTEAIEAYNVEAAKYQTALQLAKTEQADLAKLTAKK